MHDPDRLIDPATGLSTEWHFDIVLDFIFPLAHRGVTLTLVLFGIERLGIDQTRITCDLLFHPDAIEEPNFDPGPAIEFWDMTNRQDWKICEQTHRGITSDGYQPGPYSNLESVLVAFDENYLTVMNGQLKGEH